MQLAELDLDVIDSRLRDDPRTLGIILFKSVEAQTVEFGLGVDAFFTLMRGRRGRYRTLERIVLALVNALAEHFPDSHIGRLIRSRT